MYLRVRGVDCPIKRFPDGSNVVRWFGIRWYGAPIFLRIWPRTSKKLEGCGCVAVLKDWWEGRPTR